MKIGIYKITSPSDKVYIGQSVNIEYRWENYRALRHCKRQTKLYNSFLKHGVDKHVFEILEECDVSKLNCKEREWQDFYDVLHKDKGLNLKLTTTLNKSGNLSDEVKQKISIANTGRVFSEEFRKQCSDRMKLKGFPKEAHKKGCDARRGKKRDRKIIEQIIATKQANNKYFIQRLSLNGDFIDEWKSLAQIEKELGFSSPNIHNCLTGKNKKSHGYKWKKIDK